MPADASQHAPYYSTRTGVPIKLLGGEFLDLELDEALSDALDPVPLTDGESAGELMRFIEAIGPFVEVLKLIVDTLPREG